MRFSGFPISTFFDFPIELSDFCFLTSEFYVGIKPTFTELPARFA